MFSELLHQFPRVSRQVEAGIYVARRFTAYCKKVAQAHEQMASEVDKFTKHEGTKTKSIAEDAMIYHAAVSVQVHGLVAKFGERQKAFAEAIQNQVVKPLEDFCRKNEEQSKKIVAEEARLTSKLLSLRSNLLKDRQACFKCFEELLELKQAKDQEEEKENSGGKKGQAEKLAKKLQSRQQAAEKLFGKFAETRDQVLAAIEDYRKTQLPQLLEKMQTIERDRMALLKIHVNHFSHLFRELIKPMSTVDDLDKMVGALNVEAESKNFVNTCRMAAEENEVLKPLEVDIPCSAATVMSERWFLGDNASASRVRASIAEKPDVGELLSRDSSAQALAPPKPAAPSAESEEKGTHMLVRAQYDYSSSEDGVLSFKCGDLIQVLEGFELIGRAEAAWCTGRLQRDGSKGQFPTNFVERLLEPPKAAVARRQSRAAGDPVSTRASAADAAASKHAAASALAAAPASSVGPAPSPLAAAVAAATEDRVRAVYAFAYQPTGDPDVDNMGYLTFNEGDVIVVLNRDDPDWWYGVFKGEHGYFPQNMVEKC